VFIGQAVGHEHKEAYGAALHAVRREVRGPDAPILQTEDNQEQAGGSTNGQREAGCATWVSLLPRGRRQGS